MDLRAYYKKIRETQAAMQSPHVVLVSMATPDGGKPGVTTEVPAPIAARMIVEGTARQATDEETADFHTRQSAARQAAEDAAQASRLQVVVIPAAKTSAREGNEQ
jgi:hypothetical protein